MPQLLNDLVHRLGRGFDRKGAGGAPQAPVPGAVPPIQIEVDKRDILQLDVFPNVEFGPVQQRVDPDVRALREGGFELIPEFRRLIPEVPLAVLVAGLQRQPRLFSRRADSGNRLLIQDGEHRCGDWLAI